MGIGMHTIPEEGSIWQHRHKQKFFVQVMHIANRSSTLPDRFPVTVVFKDLNQKVYARKINEWFGCFDEVPT